MIRSSESFKKDDSFLPVENGLEVGEEGDGKISLEGIAIM